MMLPLQGLRVLDLSRLLPGPYCSLMLADLGADVIKIEDTRQGDYIRWSPPYQKDQSALFLALNRNKRSIRLDLKQPEGVAAFKRLVETADVVLESFRPGVMDKLGVGYEVLRQINPKLVFCAISGYGQDGPYRDKAGHDLNYLALAGFEGITGVPGRLALPGGQVADVGGGSLSAAVGILAALFQRQQTGEGRFVDISMTDGVLAFLTMHLGAFFADKQVPGPATMTLNGAYPCYNAYETQDGRWMSLGALEPKFWMNFCQAVERPDLMDKAFDQGEGPGSPHGEVVAIFKSRPLDEWVRISSENDFCGEPVLTFDELESHPLHQARGNFFRMEHPTEGEVLQVRTPVRFADASGEAENLRPAPGLGEHTDSILKEAGYSEADVAALREKQAIG